MPPAGGGIVCRRFQFSGLLLLLPILSIRLWLRVWRRCGQNFQISIRLRRVERAFDLKGDTLRYLITGGAGFIGSHLAEALIARGDDVFILDDLSTGSVENIRHLKKHDRFHHVFDSIMNKHLLAEMVDECDVVFPLASSSRKAAYGQRFSDQLRALRSGL